MRITTSDVTKKFVRIVEDSDMIEDVLNSRIENERRDGWFVLDYQFFIDTTPLKYSDTERFYMMVLFEKEYEDPE